LQEEQTIIQLHALLGNRFVTFWCSSLQIFTAQLPT
jgi:hypothetical protein